MDHQRDFDRFCGLVRRLTDTLRGPNTPIYTTELVESWWKALRHVDYGAIEQRVDAYIGKATEKTPFPRPAQMRPQDMDPPANGQMPGNPLRDHWRGVILNELRDSAGLRFAVPFDEFCRAVVTSPQIVKVVLELLAELCDQEVREGRLHGMYLGCRRRCAQIVSVHSLDRAAA